MARLLGARLDGKDERSRNFAAAGAPSIHTVRHTHYGPVLDQWVGSCTGHSAAQNLNCKPLHQRHEEYMLETDAMKIYSRATQLDPFPGWYDLDKGYEDTGSSALAAAKAARELGHISSYRWSFSFEQFLAALMLSPVVVATNWYRDMFQPDGKNFLPVSGAWAGGHAYLIVGYAAKARYFTMLNSWGVGFGRKGYARIHEDDMRKLIEDDGEAVVYVA